MAFEVNGIRSGRTSPLSVSINVEYALLVAAERQPVGDARAVSGEGKNQSSEASPGSTSVRPGPVGASATTSGPESTRNQW